MGSLEDGKRLEGFSFERSPQGPREMESEGGDMRMSIEIE